MIRSTYFGIKFLLVIDNGLQYGTFWLKKILNLPKLLRLKSEILAK